MTFPQRCTCFRTSYRTFYGIRSLAGQGKGLAPGIQYQGSRRKQLEAELAEGQMARRYSRVSATFARAKNDQTKIGSSEMDEPTFQDPKEARADRGGNRPRLLVGTHIDHT